MANSNHIIGKLWGACTIMMSDAGTTGALQYIQQFSWLLFLKVYEEIENNKRKEAEFEGKNYLDNIENQYKWSYWTDKKKNLTGDELMKFINNEEVELPNGGKISGLFHYLRNLRNKPNATKTQFVIAEIFRNSENLMKDGYYLREVIDKIGSIDFFSNEDTYAISSIYEGLFNKMKAADIKPLAEFYTPRPIAEFIAEMSNINITDTIYDPCNGPSGFLVAAYNQLKGKVKSASDYEKLHEGTLYGKELKPLPFVLGMMSMILNGIESPNIKQGNTLSTNLFSLTNADRYSVILTNPPFKGKAIGIKSNFPYASKNTAILFLQHCMKILKSKGKCAIIFPEGVLFNVDDSAYVKTKKDLVENFKLHTIIKLPEGAFAPYTTIQTNILFFEKTGATKDVWYYELPPPNNAKKYSKSNPLKIEHFKECKELFNSREITERSWNISIDEIVKSNYNLDFKNPNKTIYEALPPELLLETINAAEKKISNIIEEIRQLI
jgi:type I restriction enzyme M protein